MSEENRPPEVPETPSNTAPQPPATPPATPLPDAGKSATPDVPPAESADDMAARLERLGGEPAPAISPEEFARLQESGQIHIDSRGRIRTNRREETDAGMSLRKRRAWYKSEF